ncbi:MAG: ABC transporter permease subunit [Ornithinimicrobium sp.]
MSATTTPEITTRTHGTTDTSSGVSGAPGEPATREEARRQKRIPLTRLVWVEFTKMFDTRAGFWLLAAIGILAVIATVSVILFAPDEAIAYESFAPAVGIPMSVILPVIAILSVTSEYGQRTALSTFTLVPRRGRVIAAKAIVILTIGVVGMLVALGVGALGNLLGAGIKGLDPVWGMNLTQFVNIILANVLGMAIGFMLGVLIRNSPGAIVGYFVYSLVLPGIFSTLAAFQEWFRDLQPWVDVNFAIGRLFEQNEGLSGEMWAQLGVTSVIWIFVPMVVGLVILLRSEVK